MIADKTTPQYKKYSAMLEGTTYEKEGQRIFYYDPPDDMAVYSMTNYMTDQELQYINEQRMSKNLTNQQGKPCRYLKRLARTPQGYIQVSNQAQKIATEKKWFPENEKIDIEKACKMLSSISFEKPFYYKEPIEMEVG
jgi:hypothetical protein